MTVTATLTIAICFVATLVAVHSIKRAGYRKRMTDNAMRSMVGVVMNEPAKAFTVEP
ncbi:hypothetical protein [Bradyrhizobium sp. USDA 3256]